MAEVYSKGTRVWLPDNGAWISGEVTASKIAGDDVKLTLIDERGKVVATVP